MENEEFRVQPPERLATAILEESPGLSSIVVLEEDGHPAFEVRFRGSICSKSRRGESSDAWLVCLRTSLDGT